MHLTTGMRLLKRPPLAYHIFLANSGLQYLYCNFVSNQILSVCYFDLYYHERGNRVEFIARYGNEPKEYLSFTYFKNISQNPEEYFPQQQLKIMDEIYKRYMAKKEMV